MDTIDSQLKEAAKQAVAAGWSVRAMAAAADVPQPTLHRWLKGDRHDIALSSAVKLATFFGMRLTKPRVPKPE